MNATKIITITICIFIFACTSKNEASKKVKEQPKINYKNNEFSQHFDRLIISEYDQSIQSREYERKYTPFGKEFILQADSNKIDRFNELIKGAKRTGYCCCPDINYTIAFYNKTKWQKEYYVDTIEQKDKVVIFQSSYQYSYLVDKKDWKRFLNSLEKIDYNEYFITSNSLDKARILFNYTEKNNLIIIKSNRSFEEWENYNGSFWIKVSSVESHIDIEKIEQNIKKRYPNKPFKIVEKSYYNMCGDKDSEGCYFENIYEIYCDFDFYKNFNLYSPKSFYDKALPEFLVLGKRSELDKIDKFEKKEER